MEIIMWKNENLPEPYCFRAQNPDEQGLISLNIEGEWLRKFNEEYIAAGYIAADSDGYVYYVGSGSDSDIADGLNGSSIDQDIDLVEWKKNSDDEEFFVVENKFGEIWPNFQGKNPVSLP